MSLNELPQIIETEIIDHSFIQIRKEKLRVSGRDDYDYYTLQAAPFSVMVLATTPYNEHVLNWEYRHPTKKVLLSCPGGIMHEDEVPKQCAERELLEETGYSADGFEVMGETYPFPGICSQVTYFVRAYNAVQSGPASLDPEEFIETELFSPEKLKKVLNRKTPTDGLLLTALFFADSLRH